MGLLRDQEKALHPVLLSNRSSAFAHIGDWVRSLEDAEACIAIRPNWPRGYACKGAALEGLARHADALVAFEAALELDPSSQELTAIIEDVRATVAAQVLLSNSPQTKVVAKGNGGDDSETETGSEPASRGGNSVASTSSLPAPSSLPAASYESSTAVPTAKRTPAGSEQSAAEALPQRSVVTEARFEVPLDTPAGVGMHIMLDEKDPAGSRVVVVQLAPWSPLQGHVKAQDQLTAIDGVQLSGVSFEDVSKMVLGREGDQISLSFARARVGPDAQPERWAISLPRVLPPDVRARRNLALGASLGASPAAAEPSRLNIVAPPPVGPRPVPRGVCVRALTAGGRCRRA